ncbi:hypothetical protein K8Q98_00595 [Candidatus Nomurabacteria bacterium]|nr:hypothetical protein [Candidatus Nomurabacteria bacterium]
METILQIPIRIIKEQELVIGPLAWVEASKVSGLTVDSSHSSVSLTGDAKDVINRLVAQYERIFGQASHAVCHEAVEDLIAKMPAEEVPSSLR